MKKLLLVLVGILSFAPLLALADAATEQEVTRTIIADNAFVKKNLKGLPDNYSKEGAIEFWSSGGLMQEIGPNERPGEWLSFNVDVKHIKVTTVVPGKVAVAHYYSEGAMHPKNSAAVNNYRTRVSQVFVKEDGKWKVRSSHWSAIQGGSGTSQTALDE